MHGGSRALLTVVLALACSPAHAGRGGMAPPLGNGMSPASALGLDGALTPGNCVEAAGPGRIRDSGAPCGAAAPVALADGATVAWDLAVAPNAKLTTTQNFSLSNATNVQPGGVYVLTITQDAGGGNTMTPGANYHFPGGTDYVLSTAGDAVDTIVCYATSASVLQCVGQADFQ